MIFILLILVPIRVFINTFGASMVDVGCYATQKMHVRVVVPGLQVWNNHLYIWFSGTRRGSELFPILMKVQVAGVLLVLQVSFWALCDI